MTGTSISGWTDTTLGEVCRVKSGAGFPLKYQGQSQGEYPFFKVGDMNSEGNERSLVNSPNHIDEATREVLRANVFIPGTIVFPKVGGAISTNKKRRIVVPSCVDNNVMGLTPRSELIDADYLEWWLQGIDIYEFSNKANPPSITQATVKEWPIALPPLDEQQRIVAVLDEVFEGLARARAHAEANLQNARELFDSYLENAMSANAHNWPQVTLNAIAENLDRRRVPITKKDRKPGDIPYYGASGVVDYVADYIFDDDLLLVSEDGANLLARTYPIAFSISGKSWVNNHAHVLRFEDPDTQEYVRLYLNSISLEPYVSGMAQPKLNQAALNRIPIPFPDPRTQKGVVESASQMASSVEQLEQRYAETARDLDDLRQSLLQRAFSGELT